MDHLFSPWRLAYITGKKEPGCVFCNAIEHGDDRERLIVARGEAVFLILNRFPYTNGHLMVVPYAHAASTEDLTAAVRAEMMEMMNHALSVLRQVYRPNGFNVGINLGEAAGAGVAEHVHLHVVPRWAGDANFMSAVGNTRVMPESLEDSYQRIQAAWAGR